MDIGANDGDTTLNLAEAIKHTGGTVVAFEMGPSLPMLEYNVGLNPQYKINIHNKAVSNVSETVQLAGAEEEESEKERLATIYMKWPR